MADSKATILIVEDDSVDVELVQRGIKYRDLECDLVSVEEGRQALEFLRSIDHSESHQNLIVLLDVNMPGMNGHQFLDELRADPVLRKTIVFMLTTSDHPRDIAKAYDRNVAGYVVKGNLDALLDTLTTYFETVEFPLLAPGK